jgi:hypothetical protein
VGSSRAARSALLHSRRGGTRGQGLGDRRRHRGLRSLRLPELLAGGFVLALLGAVTAVVAR